MQNMVTLVVQMTEIRNSIGFSKPEGAVSYMTKTKNQFKSKKAISSEYKS